VRTAFDDIIGAFRAPAIRSDGRPCKRARVGPPRDVDQVAATTTAHRAHCSLTDAAGSVMCGASALMARTPGDRRSWGPGGSILERPAAGEEEAVAPKHTVASIPPRACVESGFTGASAAPCGGEVGTATAAACRTLYRERWRGLCSDCFHDRVALCAHHIERPLRAVLIGINPSEHAWQSGYLYSNPTNHMWRLLQGEVGGAVVPFDGVVPKGWRIDPDQNRMPSELGVGLTDVALLVR
jgi:hypothetical protein